VWRIFDFRFSHYPPAWATWVLAAAIYANFLTPHCTIDIRGGNLAATAVICWRTRVHFRNWRAHRGMPCDSGKYGAIRRICASGNQISSLMATPPLRRH